MERASHLSLAPTPAAPARQEEPLEIGQFGPACESTRVGLRGILANILRGPRLLLAKGTVARDYHPVEIDVEAYEAQDYEKIIPSMREVERRLLAIEADRDGCRWIHMGDVVLFHGEQQVDLPYDEFVQRVDVTHAGDYYRDSLSVDTVVTACDEQGRSLRQVVRVVALPQPNYASLFGKHNLDVYKLEKIDYEENSQRMWMLTVHSPNGSAVCDDGYLAFRRAPDGVSTIVSFLACQNFPIPPLMRASGTDRIRWFKEFITEAAYRRFFKSMMSNIIDCYHGKDFRVGRKD